MLLARGTGRDNRTTQWSVHSIEQRTGISRPNVSKAVKDLLDRGIWKKTRDGNHPIYVAVPGDEIPGGPFTSHEQVAMAAIRDGKGPPCECSQEIDQLKVKGIIRQHGVGRRNQSFEIDENAVAAWSQALPVWLPNALVDGAAGEVPPIELLRQTRNPSALSVLVELYAVQFLPSYGGVPRDLLKVVFNRAKVGEQGPFIVWGFQSAYLTADRRLALPFLTGRYKQNEDGSRQDIGWQSVFWPAVRVLEGLRLIEEVGMLLDGDDQEAEIIHPYAMRDGESAERELARVAHEAASGMVTDGQRNWAASEGYTCFVPVRRHITNVAVSEVIRLKYRPHTKATAAWYALMQSRQTEVEPPPTANSHN